MNPDAEFELVGEYPMDAWTCRVYLHRAGRWGIGVCERLRPKRKRIFFPRALFEECDAAKFEASGLPKYVAERFAGVCRDVKLALRLEEIREAL